MYNYEVDFCATSNTIASFDLFFAMQSCDIF